MSAWTSWGERCNAEHAAAVAEGKHDDACEWRPNFYLCHCSKRAREARGFTTPPTLTIPDPICDGCYGYVYFDGDRFHCDTCHVSWSDGGDGDRGEFTDDYGVLDPPPTA